MFIQNVNDGISILCIWRQLGSTLLMTAWTNIFTWHYNKHIFSENCNQHHNRWHIRLSVSQNDWQACIANTMVVISTCSMWRSACSRIPYILWMVHLLQHGSMKCKTSSAYKTGILIAVTHKWFNTFTSVSIDHVVITQEGFQVQRVLLLLKF